MRPKVTFLDQDTIDNIIDGAMTVLEKVGLHIGSARTLDILGSQEGAVIQGDRVKMRRSLVERALQNAPAEIRVFPQDSDDPLNLAGDNVHYVAGSVAPYVYSQKGHSLKEAAARDLVEHIKVLNHCESISFQSGSYVIHDVPRRITSSYRYYLSLLYSPKPIFGGAFGTDDLSVIREMLAVMVGGDAELREKPLAVVATNPSSPMGLSEIVADNLLYCAEHRIPAMLIPIPLAGGSSPVTLAGTLVQHTAEILGCLVVAQTANPGAPILFGGGPSIMDMKRGTACQASTESVIMGASIGQIAKRLKLPCATNTGRADSKIVDYQAGEESGIALTMMAMAGLNMIRGAGTLEYANVVSKEKLLIDNQICRMALRMITPMNTSDDAMGVAVIAERATGSDGYLSAPHTMQWFRSEFCYPSPLIDRGSRREFEEQNKMDAYERAAHLAQQILKDYVPREIDQHKKKELDRIIKAHARQYGMDTLPVTEIA